MHVAHSHSSAAACVWLAAPSEEELERALQYRSGDELEARVNSVTSKMLGTSHSHFHMYVAANDGQGDSCEV